MKLKARSQKSKGRLPWAQCWPGFILMSKVIMGHEIKSEVGVLFLPIPTSLLILWPTMTLLIKNVLRSRQYPLLILWSNMTSLIHFQFCGPTWLPSFTFTFVIQHDFPHPLSVLWSNMWLPSSTFTFVIQHDLPHDYCQGQSIVSNSDFARYILDFQCPVNHHSYIRITNMDKRVTMSQEDS